MAKLRGAIPTPRHRLAAAVPYGIRGATPAQWIVIPQILSFWLNDVDGDCVSAEEAFNKAASGILISDLTVQTWARAHNVLNGAYLDEVLDWMASAGFAQDGNTYNDGGKAAVDWTNAAALQNAIAQSPVKIGVAANQIETAVNTTNDRTATRCTPGKPSASWTCPPCSPSPPRRGRGRRQRWLSAATRRRPTPWSRQRRSRRVLRCRHRPRSLRLHPCRLRIPLASTSTSRCGAPSARAAR